MLMQRNQDMMIFESFSNPPGDYVNTSCGADSSTQSRMRVRTRYSMR